MARDQAGQACALTDHLGDSRGTRKPVPLLLPFSRCAAGLSRWPRPAAVLPQLLPGGTCFSVVEATLGPGSQPGSQRRCLHCWRPPGTGPRGLGRSPAASGLGVLVVGHGGTWVCRYVTGCARDGGRVFLWIRVPIIPRWPAEAETSVLSTHAGPAAGAGLLGKARTPG